MGSRFCAPGGSSGFGEEFVLVNHRRHRDFRVRQGVVHPYYFATAAYANAFGESDFRRQSEGKVDFRIDCQRSFKVETNAAGADIPGLRGERGAWIAGMSH